MVGDSNFIKLYVCLHNNWNICSKDIKQITDYQWVLNYLLVNLKRKKDWEEFYKNNSELTASITMPDNYKQYSEYQDKILDKKNKGEAVDTKIGNVHHAISNSHYDPNKGLVDENGNIIIPKERFNNMMGFDGVAISY